MNRESQHPIRTGSMRNVEEQDCNSNDARTRPASLLLSELLHQGALESQPRVFHFLTEEDAPAFIELQGKGLAKFVDEDLNRIAATARAASRLAVLQLFKGPTPICQHISRARAARDLDQASIFDLLVMLLSSGWSEQLIDGKSRCCLPYESGAPKTVFLNKWAKHISRPYLTCLLRSDEIFAKGVNSIAHFETDVYYRALLQSDPERARRIQPGCKAHVYRTLLGGSPRRLNVAASRTDDEGQPLLSKAAITVTSRASVI